MKEIKAAKVILFINCLVPLLLLGWDSYHHKLGANPIEFATRTTGLLALIFLLLSLAITPIRKIFGLQYLIRFRRMLGLYAFFYVCLHLLTYVWFDKFFNVGEIVGDILKRPFITVGMISFLLMLPLAVTSTNRWIKRLGKGWSRLHKLSYLIAIGGVVHYWMLVKADTTRPLIFIAILAFLLFYRLIEINSSLKGSKFIRLSGTKP
jgi:methionine sulfoxide reductase heme-binding subunit